MVDETLADDREGGFTCPECRAEIRRDASFSATTFACPACSCILSLEHEPEDVKLQAEAPTPTQAEATLAAGDAATVALPAGPHKTISIFLTQRGIEANPVGLDEKGIALQEDGNERYAISGELARGGMGAVLSAKDLNLRRVIQSGGIHRTPRGASARMR